MNVLLKFGRGARGRTVSTSRIESREACRCRQETTVSVAATN